MKRPASILCPECLRRQLRGDLWTGDGIYRDFHLLTTL